MNKLKKALALVLTLAMVMSLGITAFAGDATKTAPKITVNNPSTDITIKGLTVTAYKILDLGYDKDVSTTSYVYTPTAELVGSGYSYVPATEFQHTFTTVTHENIVEYIAALKDDPQAMQAFAQNFVDGNAAALAKLKKDSVKAAGETAVIDLLDSDTKSLGLGYYLIRVTPAATSPETGDTAGTVAPAIAVSLDTTDYEAVVNVKADAPVIDKEAKQGSGAYSDDAQSVEVGATVNFRLTTKVPNYNGYKAYKFSINDNMSAGLSRVADSLKVYLFSDDTSKDGALVDAKYYTVTNDVSDPDDFVITFHADSAADNNIMTFVSGYNTEASTSKTNVKIGDKIIVTYDAVVTEAALATKDENNEAYVVYSNDPTAPNDGTNPDDNSPEGKTPSEKIQLVDLKLNIKKVDGTTEDKTSLAGAVFALYKKVTVPAGTNDKYYKYNAKTVGQVSDSISWVDSAAAATLLISDTDGKLYPVADAKVDGKYVKHSTADASNFQGLEAGTYYLKEVQAPEAYNALTADIKVEITLQYTDATNKVVKTATYKFTDLDNGESIQTELPTTAEAVAAANLAAGNTAVAIVNQSGNKLPSTGGIGTTIFYTIGSIMMISALVLLITKKKMSFN